MADKKVALVTGASSGIGKAIYIRLIAKGWTVYGTSRKIEKGSVKKENGGSMIYMNVTDDLSVKEAVGIIKKAEGRLDALINNAGYGIAGAVEDTSAGEAQSLFDANFFGVLRTTRACMPLLAESCGIIVNISSVAGRLTIPFQSMYSAAKAAVEALSEALRMEAKPYGVRVCVVEPGDTKTDFTENRIWSEQAHGSKYESRMQASIKKMEHDEQNGAPPEAVAKAVYNMIARKNPPVRCTVGLSYKLLVFLKRLLPDRLVLWILGKMYA